ncbi:MAG: flavodoxin family protein [Anaerolineaceae bacterium]
MKSLVIYESTYGNTEAVAMAIAEGLKAAGEVNIARVSQADSHFGGYDLLVLGCPIIQWKPSEGMGAFMASLAPDAVRGLRFACFDTRMHLPKFLTGEAGQTMTDTLESMGGIPLLAPGRFFVRGRQGPLDRKELEHAAAWAKELVGKMGS